MTPTQASYRPGRMRQREATRQLIRETHLSATQLVMPLFVRAGKNVRASIPSMPGQFQFSIDQLVKECQEVHTLGVPAVLLFALAERKDERATRAYAKEGVLQQAVQAIKASVPELLVITDVCVCAYMSHGHCGVLKKNVQSSRFKVQRKDKHQQRQPGILNVEPGTEQHVQIDRDATLELLAKMALSHAQAGADLVAPSDMMDGNVGAIRQALDLAGCEQVPIMAYSVKYASAFYGPFRNAVDSAPQFGDRRSYQMDFANTDEALREARLDIEQGADIVMVKPALAYLDVIRRLKQELGYPVAAFSVSGEYAMIKAAAARGWLAERSAWQEMLIAMKRAGADILITYWAKEAAKTFRHE